MNLSRGQPLTAPKPYCFGYVEIVHARNCFDDLAEGVQMVNGVPEMGAGFIFDASNLASMNCGPPPFTIS
jgi:hypothetical protein